MKMVEEANARLFSAVIFATDFSPNARIAGRYAAFLAKHFGAELIAVHSFFIQHSALEAEQLGHVPSVQRQSLEKLLADTVGELTPIAGRATSVLGQGRPIDLVKQVLHQHSESMIVLGTHGGSAMERHFISSVAEEILRTLHQPVVTVGPHVAMPLPDQLVLRRILYATDFSPAAAHAASHAFALAASYGSAVDVLHIVSGNDSKKHDLLMKREEDFLAHINPSGPAEILSVATARLFVEAGKAYEGIIKHAHERGADLIVLGAHHHSHLARHLRTGPAFRTIIEATCPVLTVGAPE